MAGSRLGPYTIDAQNGPILEIPMSAIEVPGRRLSLFGGGYLRLCPKWLIRSGIEKLHVAGYPLVVYVHLGKLTATTHVCL